MMRDAKRKLGEDLKKQRLHFTKKKKIDQIIKENKLNTQNRIMKTYYKAYSIKRSEYLDIKKELR